MRLLNVNPCADSTRSGHTIVCRFDLEADRGIIARRLVAVEDAAGARAVWSRWEGASPTVEFDAEATSEILRRVDLALRDAAPRAA